MRASVWAAAAAAAAMASASDVATFTLGDALDVQPIAPRFIGFSIEVSSAPNVFLVGGLGGAPRASFAALMKTLAAAGNGGAVVRVGGNSADESAWMPSGPLPAGSTYRITGADFAAYSAAVPAWNGSIILDTTLRYTDGAAAAAHASAATSALGKILAETEVGNEPDLFFENGIRPPTYGYAEYVREYAVVAAAVAAVLPGSRPLQGGTWCSPHWSEANFSDYMARAGALMGSVSLHRYAGSHCRGDTMTIAQLMADKAAAGLAAGVAPQVTVAAAHGVPLRLGEGNSVSCGGMPGVSDRWASALWAVDALFSMAAVNVSRWHFHGMPAGPYATAVWPDITQDVVRVQPLFYGLLAFAQVAAGGAALQAVSAATTNAFIKCWAVRDAAGTWRVVVLHKDPTPTGLANATVTIVPRGAPLVGAASLTRGLPGAAGLASAYDDSISLGGLSYSATSDGMPAGAPAVETVPAGANGDFTFSLPPYSMAILSLPGA